MEWGSGGWLVGRGVVSWEGVLEVGGWVGGW